MTGSSVALVLVAAVVHASWNLLAKRARDPFAFLWLATTLAMSWLGPLALVFDPASLRHAIPALVTSALVHGLYYGTLGEAYRAGDLSRVYPIARGLGVGLAPVLALAFTGAVPAPFASAGIAIVVLSIVSLATAAGGPVRPSRRATSLALATGVLVAIYSVVDHGGVAHASPIPYLAATNAGALLVSAPFAWRRRDAVKEAWRSERRPLALAACLSLTGYLLVLYAFRLAPAAYVVAMRETSIVVATLFGRFVLGEHVSRRRALAALGIVLGAVAIALA